MEPYRLRVPGRIEELVRSLHPALEHKVRAGLDLIRTDPAVGTELRDELAGLRSLRMGRLRIVYRVAARRVIDLVAIGPRRTIYSETLRRLRREGRCAPRSSVPQLPFGRFEPEPHLYLAVHRRRARARTTPM